MWSTPPGRSASGGGRGAVVRGQGSEALPSAVFIARVRLGSSPQERRGEGARAGREAEERGSWGSLPLSWTWPCSVTLPPTPAPASPQGSEAETSAEGSPAPGWKMGFPVAAGREAKVRGGAASQPTASAGTGRPQPRGPSCVQWGERQLSCWLEPVLVAPGGAGGLHEVERVGVARALGQVLLALVHHFSVDQD